MEWLGANPPNRRHPNEQLSVEIAWPWDDCPIQLASTSWITSGVETDALDGLRYSPLLPASPNGGNASKPTGSPVAPRSLVMAHLLRSRHSKSM